VDDTRDVPEAQSLAHRDGSLGGRRHDVRHEHDAAGRGAELLCGGGAGGEAGGGEAERNRGGGNRRPPGRGVWKWPEDASDNEPGIGLARGLQAVGDL